MITQSNISDLTDKLRVLQAVKQWLSKPAPWPAACGCMGPQQGEPLCPCAMKWVENVDGFWYQIHEHRSAAGVSHSASRLSVE